MKTFLRISFLFLLLTQICFAQGYWTKVGDMPEIRCAHTVNEINGKIYIVGGGNTEDGVFPTTALVYDRSIGSWTQIPLINNEPQVFHTSCVVDGKLYIIGGFTFNSKTFGKMIMFDPNTNEWTYKAPMPTPRSNLTCSVIGNKIYVVGGMEEMGYVELRKMEVYDIATDTWTQLADMPTGRWGLRSVAYNGKIYVFGGAKGGVSFVYSSVEVYDPQTNTWTTKSNMPTPRYQLTTCLLDGNIYAIGGWYNSSLGPIYNKVEVYNPENDEWKTENSFPVARALLASIVLDGKIYVYGGSRTNHPLIGTSAIYEFSREDIFALQPFINKSYVRPNSDSVLFMTRFLNLNNHSFIPHLIYSKLVSIHTDSLTLFDDGLHGDSLSDDGIYGAYIQPIQNEEFITLSVSTIDNQTHKYYNTPDLCRFTTAGPVIVDSLYGAFQPAQLRFAFRPYLRNLSTTVQILNPSVIITCNDSIVTNIVQSSLLASTILPGKRVPCGGATSIYYDPTKVKDTLTFNIHFEIYSDGFVYWNMDTTISFVLTGIEDELMIPTSYLLEQNFPNPFNPTTKISYAIPQNSFVELKVFNLLGQEIATLVNQEKAAGTYEVNFSAGSFGDASSAAGGLPSGVYIYKMKAGEYVSTRKMILLK